jgi:hypothetical protein
MFAWFEILLQLIAPIFVYVVTARLKIWIKRSQGYYGVERFVK